VPPDVLDEAFASAFRWAIESAAVTSEALPSLA
jgi:hypothetical protein